MTMVKIQHKLYVPDSVASLIRSLHPQLKKKVRASLETILSDPAAGKELQEELIGLRSFRVSRYRVIYRISTGRRIEIVAIGPRERIYEETYRMMQKSG